MNDHIVYCTTCQNAWADHGILPVGPAEGTCACTCTDPETELWVAMSADRFVAADALIIQAEDYARQDADAIRAEAYQEGYDAGRTDAVADVGGTLSPPAVPQPLGIPADALTRIVEYNRRSLAEERLICIPCYDDRCQHCTGGRLSTRGVLLTCECAHT